MYHQNPTAMKNAHFATAPDTGYLDAPAWGMLGRGTIRGKDVLRAAGVVFSVDHHTVTLRDPSLKPMSLRDLRAFGLNSVQYAYLRELCQWPTAKRLVHVLEVDGHGDLVMGPCGAQWVSISKRLDVPVA